MSQLLIQGLAALFTPFFGLVHQQFIKDLNQPQQAQERVKAKVIARLQKTAYGSTLGIKKPSDWPQIPIVDYDSLEPWVSQQRQQPAVPILTPEKIHFWECTSGSTGPKKWIPYTTSLLTSFSNMYCIWAYDLSRHGPHFTSYKHYLCISPQIGSEPQGVADTDFLNPYLRWLLSQIVIPVHGPFPSVAAFRFALALALLEAADLEGFSIWSPSFLTTQLTFIQDHRQELQTALKNRLRPDRLELLSQPEIPWLQVWPQLKMISCWDRQHAADQAQVLQQYFPGVFIQGKGLLATEAPMTIPLIPAKGFVPLINQLVLEFLDPQGQVRQLTELDLGITYELVISQLGGLTRYRIGDRVQVSHWYFQTPCLNFVGRGEEVSDLVGEKLSLGFVTECLHQLGYLQWGFCCLAPVLSSPPHYCLFLERSPQPPEAIAAHLETALQAAVHYQRARQLNQLASLQVVIDKRAPQWLQENQRLGDCKYSVLRTKPLDLCRN